MIIPMTEVTRILKQIEDGDLLASEQLLPLVYDELRQLAAAWLSKEKPGQTLQATALVHDAWLRLVDVDCPPNWENRRHFFAAAAEAMRRILVESARRKKRQKHGGNSKRVDLVDEMWISSTTPEMLLSIDESLSKLAAEDAVAADVVKFRYFMGMSIAEAAEALGIDRSTAHRHWTYARAWIRESVW